MVTPPMSTIQPDPSPVEADCPLCRVGMIPRFWAIEAEETGETFGVDACPRCGLGRTRPVPLDLAVYYNPAYYGKRHGITARACHRRRLGIVRRSAVGRGAGRSLLDYGCAEGDFLLAARSEGWDGIGIERHKSSFTPDNLTIVAGLEELSARKSFDCATFWHVLEHLDDPVGTLAQVRDFLNPDGLVLAAVPNFGSWQARFTGASWLHLDLPRHLFHFTPRAITKTFEAAGFRVEDIRFGEFEYDVVGWSQSLLNRGLGGRNEFFKAMSGRPGRGSTLRQMAQTIAGVELSALAVVPALVESWLGRGGTLIAAARPSGTCR